MTELIEQVQELAVKMQDGTATLEEVDSYRYLACKLNTLAKASGTADLIKLEKVDLIAMIDTVATMLFPNDWKCEPSLVEIKNAKED